MKEGILLIFLLEIRAGSIEHDIFYILQGRMQPNR